MGGGKRCIYLVLVALMLITPHSSAIMGYDIKAEAESSTWELHRATQNLNYSYEGNVSGSGNFSRWSHIREIAGLEADESSSSLNGTLDFKEKMLFLTREGPVKITADLTDSIYTYDSSDPTEPDNPKIELQSAVNIDVDERWPSYYGSVKSIRYIGDGIRTRERYNNNGDVASSSIDSWRLAKDSFYKATLNRTLIFASITPQSVLEDRRTNKTSFYTMVLDSIGTSTHLEFSQNKFYSGTNRFARPQADVYISQDYSGDHKINLKVNMTNFVEHMPFEKYPWLPCCSNGFNDMDTLDKKPLKSAAGIFDCTCNGIQTAELEKTPVMDPSYASLAMIVFPGTFSKNIPIMY